MDRVIQAKEYLDSENINVSLLITGDKLIVKSSLLTPLTFIHILLGVVLLLSSTVIREAPFVVLLLFPVILHTTWKDFDSINNIVIYTKEQKLEIKRFNVLKRLAFILFNRKDQYSFDNIKKFEVFFQEYPGTAESKYLVNLILKNNKKVKLLYTKEEKHAAYIVNFLSSLIIT